MRIDHIKIHNIRSYREIEMDFLRGVNLILGENGTGKSTIIECIGYCVFNSKPEDLKAFLRQGCQKGEVAVSFTLGQGKRYQSIRTLRRSGQNNSWRLFDLSCNEELDLQGERDITDFLKQEMGMEPSMNLAALFSDIIGANQNELTTPFLQPKREREKTFNRLLMVEDYEKAADRFRTAIRELEQEIALKHTEALPRKEYADRLPEEYQRKTEWTAQREGQAQTLRDLERQAEKLEQEYQKHHEAKRRMEECSAQAERVIQGIASLKAELERNEQKAEQRLALQKKAEQLRPDFETYEATKEIQRQYRQLQQRIAADEAEQTAQLREKNEINAALAGIRTLWDQAQTEYETWEQRHAQISKEQKQKEEAYEQQRQALEAHLEQAEEDHIRLEAVQEELKITQQWLKHLQEVCKQERQLVEQIAELTEEIEDKEEIFEAIQQRQQAEEALEESRLNMARLQEMQRAYANQLADLRDGKCPFSKAACIMDNGAQIQAVEQKSEDLEKQMQQAERVIAALITQLDQTAFQQEAFVQAQKRLEKRMALEREQKSLSQDREKWIKEAAGQQLPIRMEQAGWLLEQDWESVRDILEEVAEEEQLWNTTLLAEELETNLQKIQTKISAYEKQNEQSIRDMEAALSKSKYEWNWENKRREEEETKGVEIQNRIKEYQAQEQEYQSRMNQAVQGLAQKEESLQKEKEACVKLEKEIEAMEAQSQNALEYQSAIRQLEELQGVEEEITTLKKKIEQEEEKEEALQEEAKTIETILRATEEGALQKKREDCQEQRQQTYGALQRLEACINQADANIQRYETEQRAYLQLIEQAEHLEKLLEAAKNVRQILKRSGQRIAATLRKQICEQADAFHRQIINRNARLEWGEDYALSLIDLSDGRRREIGFLQMSGGEKMSAAFCIRLAMMKVLCRMDLAFFDEPTANLDAQRRARLCDMIPVAASGFEQMFFISHDDTFHHVTQNVIQLARGQDGATERVMD